MSGNLQLKFQTKAFLDTFTGVAREVTIATDDGYRSRVMDGVTAGGYPHAMQPDVGVIGQCRLVPLSSTAIQLVPVDGGRVLCGSKVVQLSSVALTASATGKTVDTTHYAYLYESTALVLTLDLSTVLPSTAVNGIRSKLGSTDRTLVGMARVVTGPAWSTSDLLTISYFNRRTKSLIAPQTSTDLTLSVTAYAEITTQMRQSFLTWGDESVQAAASGQVSGNSSGNQVLTAFAFDGVVAQDGYFQFTAPISAVPGSASINLQKAGLSEGYHDLRVVGAVDSTATVGHWFGGSTVGRRWSSNLTVRG